MSARIRIEASLTKVLTFLVDSTLFGAVGPSAITFATIILTKNPFSWPLVLLPFFASIMIYSLNRITDREEDAINLPERIRFPHRIRITLGVISLIFYILLLEIVFQKNFLSFAIALLPLVIAILYSVFKLKRFFLVKNVSIALAFGTSVLIVPVYYETCTVICGMIFLFFFLMVLTNTIIFDIKDIKGDSVYGIQTLPVLFGAPATKYISYIVVAAAFIVIIPLVSMNPQSVLLIPGACTIVLSIHFAPECENPPWWYFGLLVDGEAWILLFSTLIVMTII